MNGYTKKADLFAWETVNKNSFFLYFLDWTSMCRQEETKKKSSWIYEPVAF